MSDITRGPRGRLQPLVKLALGLVMGALLVAFARYYHLDALIRTALAWIAGHGLLGALVYALLYILACVLFIPGSLITLGAGAIYGVVKGTALVSVASTLGATAAFLVGRFLARQWVARKVTGNPKFAAIDRAVAREGWKIVGLLRLSPVFPFNLLNYALGLTGVSLRHYFFASWIGMFPGTVLYVYLGSLAGDLARLGAGERSRTPAEWAFFLTGLAATVAVTLFVTRLARQALREKV
jgi:uncharacterized membrane protein YdjX (TVP38/TMEM64 family)